MEDKIKAVSEQIQKLLKEQGCALQPFLSFSEYGVVPRVRLVDTSEEPSQDSNQETNDKETDTEEAGGDEVADKPADAEQS